MKKLLFLILIPFCFLSAGQNWKWLNPLPQGRTINQIFAIDSLTAYAVVDNGVFIRTDDGGANWVISPTQFSNSSLNCLYFRNFREGWAAGDNGIILYTKDGGTTFTRQTSNTVQNLYGITSSGSNLFAVGANGTILVSLDNGLTWGQKDLNIKEGYSSVYFKNSSNGFITGSSGTILKTTDGGNSWINISTSETGIISALTFTSENNGWVCGQNGRLLKTVDGGISWQGISSPTKKWLTSVSFTNNSVGVFAGKDGVLLKTTDGGNTFDLLKHDSTFSFNSVSFLPDGAGWLAGSGGVIIKSSDSGFTWDFQSSGYQTVYNNVKFISDNIGYLVGNKGLLMKTTDGGDTWVKKDLGTNYNLYDVCYYYWLDKKIIFVSADSSTVFSSEDFGETWRVIDMRSLINVSLRAVAAGPYGLIVGGLSGVVGTINIRLGYRLGMAKTNMTATMTSIVFYSGNHAMVTGEGGSFYMMGFTDAASSSGGPAYTPVTTRFAFSDLNQITFYRGRGFVVGKYGLLLRTLNFVNWEYGYEWAKSYVDVTNPKGVVFLDSLNGFICGNGGTILKSTDTGNNWTRLQTNLSNDLLRMHWFNTQKGFIVGVNGLLIRTDNGGGSPEFGVMNAGEEKPVEYSLTQNYPNPFNPVTSISYSLPYESFVSLKVYDITGREISILKNETQKQGNYTVDFNGSGLPSGIYFYRLSTGTHSETRKMVLLK